MSQYAQPMGGNNYVLAGNQMHPFERIVVSDRVTIPDEPNDKEDSRIVYKSSKTAVKKRSSVSLQTAVLMILIVIAIMGSISLKTARQGSALQDEIAQLQNKYTAYEQERFVLNEQLSVARDSNFICYYASQNLGMKLAVDEETIQVAASSTRPTAYSWVADIGNMSGRR